jgi:hypothetical protein
LTNLRVSEDPSAPTRNDRALEGSNNMIVRTLIIGMALAAVAGCATPKPSANPNDANMVQRETRAAARATDAATRRNEQSNTLLNPVAQPPTQAPYAPPLPGRDNPIGPGPQAPGAGPNSAPDQ